MSQYNKQQRTDYKPAVVIRTEIANGCEWRLTEKGAISIYNARTGKFMQAIMGSVVEALLDPAVQAILQDFVNSPELKESLHKVELRKENERLERDLAKLKAEQALREQAIKELEARKIRGVG